jgi:hypothetical protein
MFISADRGGKNCSRRSQLWAEFGFRSFPSKLLGLCDFLSFKNSADEEARSQISALDEQDSQWERRLTALQAKQSHIAQFPAELARIETEQRRLFREVEAMRQEMKASVAALPSDFG